MPQRWAVKAARGDEQRAAGVQVRIGGGLGILHVAVAPQERDQPSGRMRLFSVHVQIESKRFGSPIAAARSIPYACPSPTVSPP